MNAGTNYARRSARKDYSNYNSRGSKFDNLASALDTHDYGALAKPVLNKSVDKAARSSKINISGKQTRATKVKELASQVMQGNEYLA